MKKITIANCENRWKYLERSYKKYVDNNKKTGRGRRDFEYANELNDILGPKRNINFITQRRKKYINKIVKADILKEIRRDRQEYYKRRLDIDERKLQEKMKKKTIFYKKAMIL
ncbi:hypothetical protein NQ314_009967 [Rhamnusium bicolor]|uniref:Uncharacterized protein n=1 Tax=Rhamnusium bicolor TaxID=1586634 RepID=A0AAV8XUG5_9CUCU|nr:hypothetical protein NQ314_009967 [Rhamnusium bicolor]